MKIVTKRSENKNWKLKNEITNGKIVTAGTIKKQLPFSYFLLEDN